MENAVEALKMAFAFLTFVLALTVSVIAFSNVKATSDVILYAKDETNYYDYIKDNNVSGRAAENRIVGLETIIPTLYKYYKENVDYLSLKKDGIRSIDRSDAVPIDVYNQNESAIEKALEVLKSDTYSRDDKLMANEEILGFTVSVPKFRIDNNEIKNLEIKMPYTKLPVINSSYDSECGIKFDKEKKTKKQDKSDDNGKPDNFI